MVPSRDRPPRPWVFGNCLLFGPACLPAQHAAPPGSRQAGLHTRLHLPSGLPGRRFTVQPSVQAHVVGTRHTPPWGLSSCNEPSHFTRVPGQGDQLLKPMGFFDPGGGLGLSSNWPFKHPSLSPRRVHCWGGAGRGPAGNAGFRGHPPPPPVLLSSCPTAQTHLSGPQKPPQAKCSLRY